MPLPLKEHDVEPGDMHEETNWLDGKWMFDKLCITIAHS